MSKLIYVADDEKNICFLIENFLEKEGYEVECFGDGESLLEAFEKKSSGSLYPGHYDAGNGRTDGLHADPEDEPCPDHHRFRKGFPAGPHHGGSLSEVMTIW